MERFLKAQKMQTKEYHGKILLEGSAVEIKLLLPSITTALKLSCPTDCRDIVSSR